MAGNDHYEEFKKSNIGKTFTMSKAIEYMKVLDTFPTGQNTVRWINLRTKKPVIIGYTS